jgi:hypothetical protein
MQVITCLTIGKPSLACQARLARLLGLSDRPEATSFHEVNRVGHGSYSLVMAGLGPAIHVFADGDQNCAYSASGNPFLSTHSFHKVNRVGHGSYFLVFPP